MTTPMLNIKITLGRIENQCELAGQPSRNGESAVFVEMWDGFWCRRSAAIPFDSYTSAYFYAQTLNASCIWSDI